MNRTKILLILLVMIFITACSSTPAIQPTATLALPPKISNENILGSWILGGAFIQFYEDGSYRLAWSEDEFMSDPFIIGDYTLDIDNQSIEFNRWYAENCTYIPGSYGLHFTEDESTRYLHLTVVDDPCDSRSETYLKYSPFSRKLVLDD